MKKLLMCLLLAGFLLPVSVVHGLNYETRANPESKGNQQVFIYDNSSENVTTYSINIRLQGSKVERINYPVGTLQIPTCANGLAFFDDTICFDLAFLTNQNKSDPLFSVNLQSLESNKLIVRDMTKLENLPNRNGITATPVITSTTRPTDNTSTLETTTIPSNNSLANTYSNIPYILLLTLLLLTIIGCIGFFIYIKRHNQTVNKALYIIPIILLLVSILLIIILWRTTQFTLPETGNTPVVNQLNITGCYRDKLLVKFKPGSKSDLTQLGVAIKSQHDLGNNTYHFDLDISKALSDSELNQIVINAKKVTGVESVELSCPFDTQVIPNDTNWSSQSSYMQSMNFPAAWDILKDTSSSKPIAIADSGFTSQQNDFGNNIWVNPQETNNGKDDDGNGYIDDINGWSYTSETGTVLVPDSQFKEIYQHGTAVSGIIGEDTNNSKILAGSIWTTKMMLFGIGSGSDATGRKLDLSSLLKAFEYITKNPVWAVNASFAASTDSKVGYDAVKKLGDNNIILVTAASNENSDNDSLPMYPCNWDLENIICVGALSENFEARWDWVAKYPGYSFGSNWGKTSVDIFAPGENLYVLDHKAQPGAGSQTTSFTGTSGAAPFVTAAIGLYRTKYPTATIKQVKAALLQSSRKIPSLANISVSGGALDVKAFLNTSPTGATNPPGQTPPPIVPTNTPTPIIATPTPLVCKKLPPNITNTPTPVVNPTEPVNPGVTVTPTNGASPFQELLNNPIFPSIFPTTNPQSTVNSVVPASGRCAELNNWVGAPGFYCAPTSSANTLIYCDSLRQEIPDKNISCGQNTCVSKTNVGTATCSVDRCLELGSRWTGNSGYYCSADTSSLIYCDNIQKEVVSQSVMCPVGCQINSTGQADSCKAMSVAPVSSVITHIENYQPLYNIAAPVNAKEVVCGPMDGNKNGVIDAGDFGYLALVYTTANKRRTCTDANKDYGVLGHMDFNHDGVVDRIDLDNFLNTLLKC